MNQALKECVYGMGSKRHVDFMAELAGMSEIEKQMIHLIHDGQTDLFIQEELGLSRSAYQRIESSMRTKLLVAVFDCINSKMTQNA